MNYDPSKDNPDVIATAVTRDSSLPKPPFEPMRATADMVRKECERRILVDYPMHKQLNDLERQNELLEIKAAGVALDTPQQAGWDAIEIRQQAKNDLIFCSNQMELDPPSGYQDDERWIKETWTA